MFKAQSLIHSSSTWKGTRICTGVVLLPSCNVLQVRGKEQDSYKASTRDRGLTLKVVKKAKSIVEGFYKSKDPTSFSQEEASPPKVPWKLGSSRNDNLGSSVIAMLDTIVDDFGKEQQDADKAEEKAEKELAQARHTM